MVGRRPPAPGLRNHPEVLSGCGLSELRVSWGSAQAFGACIAELSACPMLCLPFCRAPFSVG